MITTQHVFYLIGAMFAAYALLSLTDRTNSKRLGNAAFWGLLAVSLVAGSWIGDVASGLNAPRMGGVARCRGLPGSWRGASTSGRTVLALGGIASAKLLGRGEPEASEEQRTAN